MNTKRSSTFDTIFIILCCLLLLHGIRQIFTRDRLDRSDPNFGKSSNPTNVSFCANVTGFSGSSKSWACPHGAHELYREIDGAKETRYCCNQPSTDYTEISKCRAIPCQSSTSTNLCNGLIPRFVNNGSLQLEYEEVCRKSCDLNEGEKGASGVCCLSTSFKLRNPMFRSNLSQHWGTRLQLLVLLQMACFFVMVWRFSLIEDYLGDQHALWNNFGNRSSRRANLNKKENLMIEIVLEKCEEKNNSGLGETI